MLCGAGDVPGNGSDAEQWVVMAKRGRVRLSRADVKYQGFYQHILPVPLAKMGHMTCALAMQLIYLVFFFFFLDAVFWF